MARYLGLSHSLTNQINNMKKVIVLLLAAAFSITTGLAQEKSKGKGSDKAKTEKTKQDKPKKTPEQRADACANKMEKDLTLTPDQKVKVRDLALARAKKMDELREKYKGKDGDKQVWKEERKKARDEFHAGMKALLSPEQFAKWEAQKKKKADKVKKAKKGKKGTAGDDASPASDDPAEADPELDGE